MDHNAYLQILRNNGVASCTEQEIQLLSDMQHHRQSELEGLKKKLEDARAAVRALERQVDSAQERVLFSLSAASPIRRVPADVLALIFPIACRWDRINFYLHGIGKRSEHTTGCSISRVCKFWHDVARQTPEMWNNTFVFHEVSDRYSSKAVQRRLNQALAQYPGSHPIHVYFEQVFRWTRFRGNLELPWNSVTHFTIRRGCQPQVMVDILQKLPNLIYLHFDHAVIAYTSDTVVLDKLRTLEIHDEDLLLLDDWHSSSGAARCVLSSITAPALETFDLMITTSDKGTCLGLPRAADNITEFLARAPSLRRIRAVICPYSWLSWTSSILEEWHPPTVTLKYSGQELINRAVLDMSDIDDTRQWLRWGVEHSFPSPKLCQNGASGADHFLDRFMDGEEPHCGDDSWKDPAADHVVDLSVSGLQLMKTVLRDILCSREGVPDGERVAYFASTARVR
ncbi:hypothetical protein NMY22_g11735 [Coprinellus aureogranulatus]|nr:hypothetical protein NMY22_g11735 [Coprinellus aureogranulatus]